ncbi:hypothetical protein M409DRAFT_70142 [Zasmidium cellare ATCC 36951]|uniref:Enoyl reductase (ER) domain-containing protein n=1 Tax=Zasmidium cellare ATCC 36951 TaxID=1080233 RepID=A0A6A6C187_ZASCE|nr:uncharacterized protein M409DRAFT_70142 [Zasmidium cellare ATCC 36951]KAF2160817.1 hypothetical protein M409DRAFT_70142 [Zasmidium cellare ATCC 36951]
MFVTSRHENDKVLVHEIPIPEPKKDQLLVKITAASLCHSDLMMSRRPSGLGPLTIGHEGVGVVSKLHPSSEGHGFRIGDTIGMICIIDACYECEGCRVHGSFCVGSRKGGAKIQGLAAHGYFAEFAVVDWRSAILLPGSLPVERMSPLFCAGITSFHAVDKCSLEPSQWLAIVGCGGLGQLAVRYAKAMGLKICCLDVNDQVLETASQNGADAIFNTQKDPKFVRKIRQLTQSRGCHAAVVFSDAEAAYTTAQRILTFDGLLMVVGMPDTPLKFPAFAISTNLIRVKGASNGTAAELKKAVDFMAKHHIVPDVQFRPLEEMPQMWWEMANGKAKGKLGVSFIDAKSRL